MKTQTVKQMKIVLFIMLVRVYRTQCEHYDKQKNYLTHPHYSNCNVQLSGSSLSAGTTTHHQSTCKYNVDKGLFYQRISWKPPTTSTLPPTSYMLKIIYGKNKLLCFRFNASVHTFQFDQSAGFRRGRYFR